MLLTRARSSPAAKKITHLLDVDQENIPVGHRHCEDVLHSVERELLADLLHCAHDLNRPTEPEETWSPF